MDATTGMGIQVGEMRPVWFEKLKWVALEPKRTGFDAFLSVLVINFDGFFAF